DRSSLDDLHQSQVKKTKSVENGFSDQPIPLHCIYALSREATSIERLARTAATVELIRHSVPARWGLPGTADQLNQCGQFSGMVPIYRVRTFDNPDSLVDVA